MQPQIPVTNNPKPVWLGVLIAFGLHLSLLIFLQIGLVLLLGVGLVQVVYIIPAFIIARNRGETGIAKGLLIGAGITFLLNATCFGVMIFSLSKGSMH